MDTNNLIENLVGITTVTDPVIEPDDNNKNNPLDTDSFTEFTQSMTLQSEDTDEWGPIGGATKGNRQNNAITREDMLGQNLNVKSWREEDCSYCGIHHNNPKLLDIYNYCENCGCCLREPSVLRKQCEGNVPTCALEILVASYGDPNNIANAIDITEKCREIVNRSEDRDRFSVRKSAALDELFGADPSPGNPKEIRLRYRMLLRHGYIVFPVQPDNFLAKSIILLCPQQRLLTIICGSYGHPRGKSKHGRMSHDVTESLQGMADSSGGSYLCIDTSTRLTDQFGDPCKGYSKDLRIDYDISGKRGVEVVPEVRGGRLQRSLHIATGATVAPMVMVESATYGVSAVGKKDREGELRDDLSRCKLVEYRRKLMLPLKPTDMQLLRQKPLLESELQDIAAAPLAFIDVTRQLQALTDSQGGMALQLKRGETDCNALFGNPSPGHVKLLVVEVFCQGGDSEAITSSEEVTQFGYPKNVIAQNHKRFVIPVRDNEKGMGILAADLVFRARVSFPMLVIENARYESRYDKSQGFNCTNGVQRFVHGRTLHIDSSLNLDQVLGDPALGVRKQLIVHYVTRGYKGTIRVVDKDEKLVAKLELGFPPMPPADEALG